MDSNQIAQLKNMFDDLAHTTEDGVEFWYARELQYALGYTEWRNFSQAIVKAKASCAAAGANVEDHFVDVNKMVPIGSNAEREVPDVMLSRYACYLVAQNGDPKKLK